MISNTLLTSDNLKNVVQEALSREMEKEFDIAIENLNKRKREIITGILLGIMKRVAMDYRGDELIVTIREIPKEVR